MKRVYFIFKNMKEAEYYWRTLNYYFQMELENVVPSRNPFKIVMPRIKQKNIFERIFGRKENELEIIFKSDKHTSIISEENEIYYFFENEYDACYFIDFLKGI